MATDKPKIQGYVGHLTWQFFQKYQQSNRLSQSQALDALLIKALGIGDGETRDTASQQSTECFDSRLKSLEKKQHDDYCSLKDLLLSLEEKVASLEKNNFSNPLSDLLKSELSTEIDLDNNPPSDPLETESGSNSNPLSDPLEAELGAESNINSNLLSNLLEAESDLDSNLLSNLLETESDLDSNLLSNLLETESDLDSNLLSDPLEAENDSNSNLPSELWETLKLGLSEAKLTERLNLGTRNTLGNHRKKGDLAEWSRDQDPNGFAWRVEKNEANGKVTYFPIAE